MIKIENLVTLSPEQWECIIMGTRNPMNSWDRSDSCFEEYSFFADDKKIDSKIDGMGPNDHTLMMKLAKAGPVHAKYRRMIAVYVDITAPLYWWKEFDTYKVGTVTNSCSTMHKIADKEFTLDDFSCEHLFETASNNNTYYSHIAGDRFASINVLEVIVEALNIYRTLYNENHDKSYWWQMIQLLPSSYNQKRTVMLNYEVLYNIYYSRKGHKLDEWNEFCAWIESLPYSEIVTLKEE